MNEMMGRFYMLKISLVDIEPVIWRRFMVPGFITLDRLHDVIQIVMGWKDSHIHEFTIGKKRYTEYPESREDGLECGQYRLVNLIKQKGRTFRYRYDFGDNWEHELLIEDSDYFNQDLETMLFCLGGERACPPEDVGGAPGYHEFCRVVKDRKHKDRKRLLKWAGGSFKSEYFDAGAVNDELQRYLRWSRDRFLDWLEIEWFEDSPIPEK